MKSPLYSAKFTSCTYNAIVVVVVDLISRTFTLQNLQKLCEYEITKLSLGNFLTPRAGIFFFTQLPPWR